MSSSTGYAPSISASSSSSSSSQKARKVSSGRGGSGNIVKPTKLISELDDAEILQRRKMQREAALKSKINYTGRGGSGNILAASKQQDVPYDISRDPDDAYENIILSNARKVRATAKSSTGRGGTGNVVGQKETRVKVKPSEGKKLWRGSNISISDSLSSGYSNSTNSSHSSPRHSRITLTSDSTPPTTPTNSSFPYSTSRGTVSMTSFLSPVPKDMLHQSSEEEFSDYGDSPRRRKGWFRLPRRRSGPQKDALPPSPEFILDVSRNSQDAETQTIRPEADEDLDHTPSPTRRHGYDVSHIQALHHDGDDEEDYSDSEAYDPYTTIEDIEEGTLEDDVSAYELEVIREAENEAALYSL